MKIRNGFVSNSSSSSFVIVGKYIEGGVDGLKSMNPKKVEKMIKEKRLMAGGDATESAEDFFVVTKKMWNVIVSSGRFCPFCFYDVFDYGEFIEVDTKKLAKIGEKVYMMALEVDQHSLVSFEDFMERYYDED